MRLPILGTMLTASVTALGLVTASAQAGTTAEAKESASATEAAARPDKAKPGAARKYCLIEEMTGSRIGKKACRTKAEWKALGVEIAMD